MVDSQLPKLPQSTFLQGSLGAGVGKSVGGPEGTPVGALGCLVGLSVEALRKEEKTHIIMQHKM